MIKYVQNIRKACFFMINTQKVICVLNDFETDVSFTCFNEIRKRKTLENRFNLSFQQSKKISRSIIELLISNSVVLSCIFLQTIDLFLRFLNFISLSLSLSFSFSPSYFSSSTLSPHFVYQWIIKYDKTWTILHSIIASTRVNFECRTVTKKWLFGWRPPLDFQRPILAAKGLGLGLALTQP